MRPSTVVFKFAETFPSIASAVTRSVAPRVPYHWTWGHLAKRLNIRVPVEAVLPNGTKMNVLLGDGIGNNVLKDHGYERESVEAVQSLLKPESVFFDIGAHMGLFTLQCSPLLPSGSCVRANPRYSRDAST